MNIPNDPEYKHLAEQFAADHGQRPLAWGVRDEGHILAVVFEDGHKMLFDLDQIHEVGETHRVALTPPAPAAPEPPHHIPPAPPVGETHRVAPPSGNTTETNEPGRQAPSKKASPAASRKKHK